MKISTVYMMIVFNASMVAYELFMLNNMTIEWFITGMQVTIVLQTICLVFFAARAIYNLFESNES